MSRFYGSIEGSGKTPATRQGTPKTGIDAHISGWDIGVKIRCYVDKYGLDICEVYETGGSNSPQAKKLLTKVYTSEAEQSYL